jgi:hypothetical protein
MSNHRKRNPWLVRGAVKAGSPPRGAMRSERLDGAATSRIFDERWSTLTATVGRG